PIEEGELAVVEAVGGADPDVVAGGAAVAFAEPLAGAADVGNQVAARREDAVLAPGGGDAPLGAALGGDGEEVVVGRKAGAARRGEEDVFAVGRPAAGQ